VFDPACLGWKCSVGGGEQLLVDGSFNDRLGLLAALAALGGNTELATDFSEGSGTFGDGFTNLAIGYGFAEADVHGGDWVADLL
jgi:hypothetical protein